VIDSPKSIGNYNVARSNTETNSIANEKKRAIEMEDSAPKRLKLEEESMQWTNDNGNIADLVNVIKDEISNYAPCMLL
jgi:hypothetical protein